MTEHTIAADPAAPPPPLPYDPCGLAFAFVVFAIWAWPSRK